MDSSCIVTHFRHYSPLSENDVDLLHWLEKDHRLFDKNTSVWAQGEPSRHFYTVSKGWAYSYRQLEDGSRQVLDVYVPGDVVGLREFAFEKRITSLTTLTDAELCPFPKTHLTQVFSESLLLCHIFFTMAARDQAILLERLVNLGRRSALQKIAHFLVEVSTRLGKTTVEVDNYRNLPLSQTLLADALGLSTVHVSRTFAELKQKRLAKPAHGGVELLDMDGLAEVAGFDSNYLEEDIADMLEYARTTQERTGGGAGHAAAPSRFRQ